MGRVSRLARVFKSCSSKDIHAAGRVKRFNDLARRTPMCAGPPYGSRGRYEALDVRERITYSNSTTTAYMVPYEYEHKLVPSGHSRGLSTREQDKNASTNVTRLSKHNQFYWVRPASCNTVVHTRGHSLHHYIYSEGQAMLTATAPGVHALAAQPTNGRPARWAES